VVFGVFKIDVVTIFPPVSAFTGMIIVSTQPRCENSCCWFCQWMAGKYCEHSHMLYIFIFRNGHYSEMSSS